MPCVLCPQVWKDNRACFLLHLKFQLSKYYWFLILRFGWRLRATNGSHIINIKAEVTTVLFQDISTMELTAFAQEIVFTTVLVIGFLPVSTFLTFTFENIFYDICGTTYPMWIALCVYYLLYDHSYETTENYWELLRTTENYWELMGTTGNYWKLLGTTGNYWEPLGARVRFFNIFYSFQIKTYI